MKEKKIAVIGMGVVGTALAVTFKKLGYQLVGIYRRNFVLGREQSSLWQLPFHEDLISIVKGSDWIIIATSDGAIEGLVRELVYKGALKEGQVLVHLSGTLTSQIFGEARNLGVKALSMHPLQSFARVEQALKDLPLCYFSLEGDKEAIEEAKVFLRDLRASYFELEPESKVLYHMAAVMASNYLVTLNYWAEEAFRAAGLSTADGKALIPLMKSVINNLEKSTPTEALTGPIARGDVGTVRAHLKALESLQLNDLREIYSFLGQHTLPIGLAKGSLELQKMEEMKAIFLEKDIGGDSNV